MTSIQYVLAMPTQAITKPPRVAPMIVVSCIIYPIYHLVQPYPYDCYPATYPQPPQGTIRLGAPTLPHSPLHVTLIPDRLRRSLMGVPQKEWRLSMFRTEKIAEPKLSVP